MRMDAPILPVCFLLQNQQCEVVQRAVTPLNPAGGHMGACVLTLTVSGVLFGGVTGWQGALQQLQVRQARKCSDMLRHIARVAAVPAPFRVAMPDAPS